MSIPGRRTAVLLAALLPTIDAEANLTGPQPAQPHSCLNESMKVTPLPVDIDQNANRHGIYLDCLDGVQWEMSDFLLNLLSENKVDPSNFKFQVCWDRAQSSEKRHFPWIHSTTGDWHYELAYQGSVMLHPISLMDYWLDGYQQVVPDAMDYWARMGEIVGRLVIPKFMLYGWSKGAICNWPLGRWRPDLVQGVVSVSGCVSRKYYDKTYQKKADNGGAVPYLFYSSWRDGYLQCSPGDTVKQYKKQKEVQPLTYHVETPCGHHPERCWPACDYNHTYVTPFWDFVKIAYAHQECVDVTDKETCDAYLCNWDDDLSVCTEEHPTRFTPSCATFCGLDLVEACHGLEEAACSTSYRILSEEATTAKGVHSRCRWAGGQCVPGQDQHQCFFQDECPAEAAVEPMAQELDAASWQTIYA